MSNELNLSSAKTVAGENTTENFNEQQNAARVSNSNENKVMDSRNHQSSMASQADANETAIGNAEKAAVKATESTTEIHNDVKQMEASTVAVLLGQLGEKLPKKVVKYSVSYREAKSAGLKVAFLKENRNLNSNHISKLWDSVKSSNKFANGCYVVPLRPILEKYGDIEAYGINVKQITLDTPDLDMYLAVYDGQHRITVCELSENKIDVELELNEFDGSKPLEVIKNMNFYSRNWNGQDLRDSIVKTGASNSKLFEEAKILTERYSITQKLAEYILTFVSDATKKRDLIDGKDTTTYNEDNAKRGKDIFEAYIAKFNGDKVAKKIELMHAVVHTYNSLTDADKPAFARTMKLYMGNLKEDKLKIIKDFIVNKNFGELNKTIKDGYDAFCNLGYSTEKLKQMETEIDRGISTYIDKVDAANKENTDKKLLKSGRVNEVIAHYQNVKSASSKAKLDKVNTIANEACRKVNITLEEYIASINQTPIEKPEL